MSRRALYLPGVLAALLVTGCSVQDSSERVWLDLGDAEDYQEFLEDRGDVVVPVPFKPEPLFVSAIGKVQAQPDIAVITAKISAEDKNESRAVNEMGEIINAVQTALKGRNIETGFTAINSEREFDERCRNENRFAQRRHNEIRNDFYFNQRLDRKGDTKTKRRDPKPRVAQATCFAQAIKVSTNMVIRIQPADAAGDVLRALSDAGAENSRLYGYDFTDYDALYQEAAAKAVKLAREKAQTVARLAGGTLGEIESFSVSVPERTGRFGPQPNVIRSANRYRGDDESVIERHVEGYKDFSPPPKPRPRGGNFSLDVAEEIIVTATKRTSKSLASPAPISVEDAEPISFAHEAKTQYSAQNTGYSVGAQSVGNGNTNALSISLLSGPQTISVGAQLGYTYDTPLNGKIIIDSDDEG